jgi:hypothetical protein
MARDDTDNLNDLLSAYIDDALDTDASARVEAHLAANPKARALYDELRSTRDLLIGLPRDSAPNDLIDTVTAQLERRALLDTDDETAAPFSPGRSSFGRLLATAAMLAVFVTAGFVIYQNTQIDQPAADSLALMTESDESVTLSPAKPTAALETASSPAGPSADPPSADPPSADALGEIIVAAVAKEEVAKPNDQAERDEDAIALTVTESKQGGRARGMAGREMLKPDALAANTPSQRSLMRAENEKESERLALRPEARTPVPMKQANASFYRYDNEPADDAHITLEVEATTVAALADLQNRLRAYETQHANVTMLPTVSTATQPTSTVAYTTYTIPLTADRLPIVLTELGLEHRPGLRVRPAVDRPARMLAELSVTTNTAIGDEHEERDVHERRDERRRYVADDDAFVPDATLSADLLDDASASPPPAAMAIGAPVAFGGVEADPVASNVGETTESLFENEGLPYEQAGEMNADLYYLHARGEDAESATESSDFDTTVQRRRAGKHQADGGQSVKTDAFNPVSEATRQIRRTTTPPADPTDGTREKPITLVLKVYGPARPESGKSATTAAASRPATSKPAASPPAEVDG